VKPEIPTSHLVASWWRFPITPRWSLPASARKFLDSRTVRMATINNCRPAWIFSKLPYVHISLTECLSRVKKSGYSHHTSPILTSISTYSNNFLFSVANRLVRYGNRLVQARSTVFEDDIRTYIIDNIFIFLIIRRWPLASARTYPREAGGVDLALRTDWCVWLP
jgi:hypothetical protein